jgi:hypothetical protein
MVFAPPGKPVPGKSASTTPSLGTRVAMLLERLWNRERFTVRADRNGLFLTIFALRSPQKPSPQSMPTTRDARPPLENLVWSEHYYLWCEVPSLVTWLAGQPSDCPLMLPWPLGRIVFVPRFLVRPLVRRIGSLACQHERMAAGWGDAWDQQGQLRVPGSATQTVPDTSGGAATAPNPQPPIASAPGATPAVAPRIHASQRPR